MSFYFAYGSNLNKKQMLVRMQFSCCEIPAGTAKLLGSATLPNYKLDFSTPDAHKKGAGYANIHRFKGQAVHGAIYEVDRVGFARLDVYECVPKLYKRTKVNVVLSTGVIVRAFVYIGNKKLTKPDLKPTKRYLKRILLGRSTLPKDYSKELAKTITVD
ncbi:gamma-glutamylcyclotransferase [Candidatus Micrarchaeota archaeon]|nr:gamma-glutamylcyclotransferase [Candidatus Micrarchaeota archaeon]